MVKRDTEISSRHLLKRLLLAIRAVGSLVSGRGEVNCLENAVAISSLLVRDLEEKAMGRLELRDVVLSVIRGLDYAPQAI